MGRSDILIAQVMGLTTPAETRQNQEMLVNLMITPMSNHSCTAISSLNGCAVHNSGRNILSVRRGNSVSAFLCLQAQCVRSTRPQPGREEYENVSYFASFLWPSACPGSASLELLVSGSTWS